MDADLEKVNKMDSEEIRRWIDTFKVYTHQIETDPVKKKNMLNFIKEVELIQERKKEEKNKGKKRERELQDEIAALEAQIGK